jgi:X-Pro dipeptidyl-peptidase
MRTLRTVTPALIGLLLTMGSLSTPTAAAAPRSPVVDNETQPIYSYADAIRETVFVESAMDSDNDGRRDRIAADVMRPKETDSGLKAPIVMEASPYYGLSNLAATSTDLQVPKDFRRWYDEFFVPRGYAVVEVEMQGTSRSEGCPTTGAQQDTLSIKAVVDWLNGRATATHADGTPASAGWSTGAVGMLGVSYNGTLPNALAAAGVDGVKTIVPIAAISSWYDYARDTGIAYSGWDRRYPEFLANFVVSPTAKTKCANQIKALGDNAGDNTFDMTPFWAARNYRLSADNVKASVFVVHGLEDWNVKTANFGRWWSELQARNIPRKIWLHRGAHLDPIGFRQAEWQAVMHRWMDFWLFGLQTGVMNEPMADIQRRDGTWETHNSWPETGTSDARMFFGPARSGVTGTLNRTAATSGTQSFTDAQRQTESTAFTDYTVAKANRLDYVTPPLTQSARLSGTAHVNVTVRSTATSAPLTALLIDYGPNTAFVGQSKSPLQLMTESCTMTDVRNRTGCATPDAVTPLAVTATVISRGAVDLKNRNSLTTGQPLTPNQNVTVRWDLHPKDYIVAAGHRIGLVLMANDSSYIAVDTTARGLTVSLAPSSVDLPVVGGTIRF